MEWKDNAIPKLAFRQTDKSLFTNLIWVLNISKNPVMCM